ncbi:hypothetical protein [Dyella subtropica]|uniref:hypothetical protein n=1 Tax=Dyella subtropica TaxID=2992127 RepID=UPI002253DE5F|nr:hypothetical protein [Dyella subtropica]
MKEFNFKGLHPAFVEAINRHEPSIAFTLADGNGRFVFLLFMATNSSGKIVWGDLELFILLARTQTMLRFKLLGNHKNNGDFKVRFNSQDEAAIRVELGLHDAAQGPAFALESFLSKLNGMIPTSIPLEEKIATIKTDRGAIESNCKSYFDEASKVYLLRAGPLPAGKHPREETLRKLYMLNASATDIASLITNLKKIRWTTYWTATKSTTSTFAEIFAKVTASVPSH